MSKARFLAISITGLMALLLILLVTDIGRLAPIVSRASPFYLLVSTVISVLTLPARAIRWRSLLAPVKERPRLGNLFWIVSIGLFLNALIPIRVGEFARALLLKVKEGVGFVHAFSSIVVERLLDLMALAAMGTFALLLAPLQGFLPSFLTETPKVVGILVSIALGAIVLGSRSRNMVLNFSSRLLSILPKRWKESVMNVIASALTGAGAISSSPLRTAWIAVVTASVWLLQYVSYYFIFLAFGIEPDLLLLLLGSVIFTLSFILPAPPGYVGTYETFWVLIFSGLGMGSNEILLAMAILSHSLLLASLVPLGFFGTAFMGMSVKELLDARRYSLSSH